MHEVFRTSTTGHRVILATRETFEEAKAFVQTLGVCHMEDDSDFPDCADAYLNSGDVVTVQPVGFKLKGEALAEKATEYSMSMYANMEAFDAEFLTRKP